MTANEVAEVYMDILPGLLQTLQGRYGLTKEGAEDLAQNSLVGLLEQPHRYLEMIRPQVEAWFRTHDAGRGRGLRWRVRRVRESEEKRRARENRWLRAQKKVEECSSYNEGVKQTTLVTPDIADAVILCVDAEKAMASQPKRKRKRSAVQAIKEMAVF